jgi:hypothetical protein
MKLLQLLKAEMYRDGGSLEAIFLDATGVERSLFLEVSRMPDQNGYHHKDLYASRYRHKGAMPDPIPKGSEEEHEWIDSLAAWIAVNISRDKLTNFRSADFRSPVRPKCHEGWTIDDWKLYWLVLLFDHIPKREGGRTSRMQRTPQ